MLKIHRAIRFSVFLFLLKALPGADWPTFGGNPQRTGWAMEEKILNKKNARSLQLLWKNELDNQPKFMNGLTAAVVKESVILPKNKGSMTDVLVVGGSSDNVYALNAENGKLIWKKTFPITSQAKTLVYILCPKALNATPVIEDRSFMNQVVYAVSSDGLLHTMNVSSGSEIEPAIQFVPPFSKNWSLNILDGVIYTATSQGCGNDESSVYSIDTKDPARQVRKFLVTNSGGGGIWGRGGVAIDPSSGKVYAETGDGSWNPKKENYTDSIISLSHKILEITNYFTPINRDWITRKDLDLSSVSPVVFSFNDKVLVAASGKEGVIYLLDTDDLGGSDHRIPLFASQRYSNDQAAFSSHGIWGALSTYEDENGNRWLYAPSWGPVSKTASFQRGNGQVNSGTVMAFRVVLNEKNQKPVLVPIWTSRNMHVPEPVVIAGGVVFTLSNGANVDQVIIDADGNAKFNEERHSKPSGNAVLYALDADTGQELWSSGTIIDDWTHFSGLAIANGRIFVTTHGGKVFAFGKKEGEKND